MKLLSQTLIIAILILGTTISYGQNTINDFTASGLSSEENDTITYTFIKSDTNLVWKQDNDGAIQEVIFTVNNITGTWDEAIQAGQVVFTAVRDAYQVTFTLTGTTNGITAELSIANQQSSSDVQTFEFKIDTINFN